MKTFKVVENRTAIVEYEIIAESEEMARSLDGDIIDCHEIDNYSYDIISCQQIGEEEEA